jgi:hypothetical protein
MASARRHRARREIPLQGPYSYDLICHVRHDSVYTIIRPEKKHTSQTP